MEKNLENILTAIDVIFLVK